MDSEDFAPLYERLQRPLFAYAAARLSPQVALDVVHDTFEVVWAKRRFAPRTIEDQNAWCYGIARKKVLQEAQRRSRKHHDNRFVDDFESAAAAAINDIAEAAAEAVDGRRLWLELSLEERELVTTILMLDGGGEEAAKRLGISHAAFRKRVSRVRGRIGALGQLQESGDDAGRG